MGTARATVRSGVLLSRSRRTSAPPVHVYTGDNRQLLERIGTADNGWGIVKRRRHRLPGSHRQDLFTATKRERRIFWQRIISIENAPRAFEHTTWILLDLDRKCPPLFHGPPVGPCGWQKLFPPFPRWKLAALPEVFFQLKF